MTRTITTTGEHLVFDVALAFTCWTCDGAGVMAARDPQESEKECLDCNGTGLSVS
jgi:DnaJ-class molecular chaperone